MAGDALHRALKDYFGHNKFREYQEEIIEHMLGGRDVFATLPTGHGKSLCYQLPAAMQTDGVTLVVSPLIALIRDQAYHMSETGIPCTFLDSLQTEAEYRKQLDDAKSGGVRLLYLSPERLQTKTIYEDLRNVKVNRIVVDEAHCVSMWGHDFRPSYIQIQKAREMLGNPPIAAFTATAPVCVRDDIVDSLHMADAVQIHADVDRPNLSFDVEKTHKWSDKETMLFDLLGEAISHNEPAIVYCARTKTVDNLAEITEGSNIACTKYHGRMERDDRIGSQAKFLGGAVPIMFATRAFGMGIDKPNIRRVIHFEVPDSLEGYYQEAGRAGRDGKPAGCTLLYQFHDVHLQRGFVLGSNPSLDFIEHIYYKLWSRVRPHQKQNPVPSMFFRKGYLMEEYEVANPIVREKVSASLAALEEYCVITTQGNEMKFLLKPDDLKHGKSPLKEGTLRAKYDHDMQRLKIMLYYATADEEPRSVILRHFRHNTVVEDVEAMEFDDFVELDPEHVKMIMLALAHGDYEKRYLPGLMTGAKESKNPMASALNGMSPDEIRVEVDHAASNGLLRLVPIGDRTYVTLTEDGMEKLENDGCAGVLPCHDYRSLSARMFNPMEKRTLKNAMKEWFGSEELHNRSQDEWWNSIRDFMGEEFWVLGKKVTGIRLTADYVRKAKGKVKLKDARLLLDYVFDGRVGC